MTSVPPRRAHAWQVRIAWAVVLAIVGWACWSYFTGGLLRVLLAPPSAAAPTATGAGAASTLDAVRTFVLGYGAWAPMVYVAAVTVEVLVAPIPGALLYAPAGAIFGGFLGGTLSLIGNVLGAAIACWLATTFGQGRLARHASSAQLARIRERLQREGAWVIFLLRLNPLTSSDLVSYAAGLAEIPVRHVALGTFLGMIPQCYAQAYLAQTIFEALPAGPWVVVSACALAIVAAVVVWRVVSR